MVTNLPAMPPPEHAAAQVVADSELFGAGRSVEDTARRLRSIRGMGEGLAAYIAARQLREPDAFPAADPTLRLALTDADGRRPDASQLLARAESWRPWRAYAAQHLWGAV